MWAEVGPPHGGCLMAFLDPEAKLREKLGKTRNRYGLGIW